MLEAHLAFALNSSLESQESSIFWAQQRRELVVEAGAGAGPSNNISRKKKSIRDKWQGLCIGRIHSVKCASPTVPQ